MFFFGLIVEEVVPKDAQKQLTYPAIGPKTTTKEAHKILDQFSQLILTLRLIDSILSYVFYLFTTSFNEYMYKRKAHMYTARNF